MQAVADALSLLANIVMAWNTAQMQAVLDRWAHRRQIVPPELIGRIAPTRLGASTCEGSSASPSSATPDSSCRHKRQPKQVPVAEIDQASVRSAALSEDQQKAIRRQALTRYDPSKPAPFLTARTVTYCTEIKWTPGRTICTRAGQITLAVRSASRSLFVKARRAPYTSSLCAPSAGPR